MLIKHITSWTFRPSRGFKLKPNSERILLNECSQIFFDVPTSFLDITDTEECAIRGFQGCIVVERGLANTVLVAKKEMTK